jgi:TonB family protein
MMRTLPALTGLAAIAAALAAAPARAQAPDEPWARVGEWEVRPFLVGRCDIQRGYPGGTRLFLRDGGEAPGRLFVVNRDWSLRGPGRYRLKLVRDGRRVALAAPGGADDLWQGLAAAVDSDVIAGLSGGASLEVEAPDGRLIERLDLAGLAPALAPLRACGAQASAASFPAPPAPPPPPPPSPRRGREQPARAQANLVSLFSSDDYPAAAARAGEQGSVGFRLDIDKAGRVAACEVTSSSGSAALDSTTCRLVSARARFSPARDRKGRPTTDKVTGRIVWRMPEPEPPAPPPS